MGLAWMGTKSLSAADHLVLTLVSGQEAWSPASTSRLCKVPISRTQMDAIGRLALHSCWCGGESVGKGSAAASVGEGGGSAREAGQ